MVLGQKRVVLFVADVHRRLAGSTFGLGSGH